MKTLSFTVMRMVLASTFAVALLASRPAAAEDIDLYAGSGGGAVPNVLFFLDNSSNWSASSQAWSTAGAQAKCTANYGKGTAQETLCLSYVSQIFGSDTSLVQGQVELRALRLVLDKLVCGNQATLKLKAGLMMFNPSGTADGNSVIGGYIRKHVMTMDSARCAEMLADLADIDSKITTPDFKGPSSAEYGAPLYEAFKYFGGYTNPAGVGANTAGTPSDATHFGPIRYSNPIALEDAAAFTDSAKTTYKSPIDDGGTCGNNYIILIGNTWPNQEYGTNANATPYPTNQLMSRLSYNPGAQIYPVPLTNNDKTNVRFADEWAKFLYTTDVSSAGAQQNIRMFTIDVYNKSADAKQGALLKSMADTNGPGGYFSVGGDLKALIDAITDALTKIAAVNGVFASASLPVSVNAQGTFLNQVFMGVFRPDPDGNQRWAGNLKQYRFALNGNSLYLADTTIDPTTGLPTPAVDSQNTGFIQTCAVSYWTSDSGTYWTSVSGAKPSACAASTNSPYSDSPDGPLVERGGAAQRLRNLGYAARNIRTCNDETCTSMVDFNETNVTKIGATLVNWARGQNLGDGNPDQSGKVVTTDYGLGSTATRPTVHGEVIHSRPLAVNYGSSSSGGDDVVVFYGAGDGMLHAVNGNQTGSTAGSELWAFVAPEHWSSLDRVRTNSPIISYPNVPTTGTPTPIPKTYFFDGSIGGYQERTSTTVNKLWIYPSMRRGGTSVYAFDVTTKPSVSQPGLMWKYSDLNDSKMGQSWSTPLAIRIKGRTTPLVVFGAGYDICEDNDDPNTACAGVNKGRGIVVMNAQSGPSDSNDYRFIDPGSNAGRFVADMTPVDVNGDGYVDVLYAVDTRGNIWRINTSDPASNFNGYAKVSDWPVVHVGAVGQWGAGTSERRKLMYAPSAVVLGTQVTVLVGTGDREKPSSTSNAALVVNRFYGIRDNVAATTGVTAVIGYGTAPTELYNVTSLRSLDPLALASYKGWYRDLSTRTAPYEQVVTTPLTIAGVTYFSTYQAKVDPSSSSCLGTARAYQIDFQTGTPLPGQDDVAQLFLSPGIPPSPVGGLVTINGQTIPFLIGGTGPTVLSPTKIVPKVKPNRKPVYRYQRIDG